MNFNEIAKGHWAYSPMDEALHLKSCKAMTKLQNIPYHIKVPLHLHAKYTY